MALQTVFKRYELKYMLTLEQKLMLLERMIPYMKLDDYGRTTIRNIYYDTDNYRLVRRSNEKPVYKEKLRVRSYSKVSSQDAVFVELKKKYQSVVYKRRSVLSEHGASLWLIEGVLPGDSSQINDEIEYFRGYYKTLEPKVFLSYEREAYYDMGGSDFRVTFDENILARTDRLSLCEDVGGDKVLPNGRVLMELKVSQAIPFWMTEFLTENRIFKTSFSKYGTVYNNMILNKKGDLQYA